MREQIDTYKATTKWHKRYGRKMTKYSPSINGNWCKVSEVRQLESEFDKVKAERDEAVELLKESLELIEDTQDCYGVGDRDESMRSAIKSFLNSLTESGQKDGE